MIGTGQHKEVVITCGERIFNFILAPIVDAGYVNWYGSDITLHKRDDDKLIASESRYRRLFEAARDGILILDTETGQIEDVNPFMIEMLGFSFEELVGMKIWDLGSFHDIAENEDKFRDLQKNKYVRYENLPLVSRGGKRFEVEFVSNVYKVDHRDVIQCNIRDITERVRIERALDRERYLIDTLLDTIPDFIYFKDNQSRFIRISKALALAFGLSNPGDAIGKTDFDFFTREHAQTTFEDEQKIIQTGQPMIGVVEKETWPGRGDTWTSSTKMPLRDEKGEISGTFGISRDITATRQAQESLANQAEELRLRIVELDRLYLATGALLSSIPFDAQTLAKTIVEVIRQDFSQTDCSVFVIGKDGNHLDYLAAEGLNSAKARNTSLTVDGASQISNAVRSGLVIITPDVRVDPKYPPYWDLARSELSIPLKAGDHVIGLIDLQSTEPNTFTRDDERLLTIFAERAALILESGLLNHELNRRLAQLSALHKIDIAIASSMDMHFTLGVVLDQAIANLGIDAADILVVDPILKKFKFAAEQGFRVPRLLNSTIGFGNGLASRVLREKQIVEVHNLMSNLPELRRSGISPNEGFVSFIGIPLIAKGQVSGVLGIFNRSPLEITPDFRSFLEMVAGQTAIAIDNALLFENLQDSNFEIMMAYDETIEGWSRAMDLRDKETEGHTQRATEMTLQLAAHLGLGAEEQANIRRGALLHDIGKIGVPDAILHKPGPLTEEEWVIMRQHPRVARELLISILYLRRALDIPYCHHEKWDGTGYPRGLRGEQIPLAARIFAVVDVWDALSSDRPYRKAWPKEKVYQYIRDQAGIHFDPHIADIFLKMFPDFE